MNEEERLIKEQWDKLPPELQRVIESVPWKSLVGDIGKTNALDSNKIAILERETMFILYGLENPADYLANIEREVGLSEEQSAAVAGAIADKIFDAIFEKVEIGETAAKTKLPMIEEGEKVHDVPHVDTVPSRPEEKPKTPLPDYRYPDGTDPYREPLS